MSEQEGEAIPMEEIDHKITAVKESQIPHKERMEKIPGRVWEVKTSVYEISRKISGVKKALALREATVAKDVAQQKETTGEEENPVEKPKYPTVGERENEVRLRCARDEEHKGLKAQEDMFHEKIERLKIDLDMLQNLQRNTRRLMDLEERGR